MSVASGRSSSSSYSTVGSHALSATRSYFDSVGGGKSRTSSASSRGAPSVYGGAGGYGTRISQSGSSFSMGATSGEITMSGNEKLTMQNLNERLATYLEKVRSLEAANSKLELQIKAFYERRSPSHGRDFNVYFSSIETLRAQLMERYMEHAKITLQVENARLAADDFKMKFEMELNMRMTVESDTARLRGILDSMTLARSDMEMQINGLKEELVYMKKNHEEEMSLQRTQQSGAVTVEMDCAASADLNKELQEMRAQYEALVHKNQTEAEKWFQSKVAVLHTQIASSTTEVKSSQSQLVELRRSSQSLEIELQGMLSQSVQELNSRYSTQLTQHQLTIHSLESELQQLNASIQQQGSEYKILLDIKMRLELEIAEYRRLLDGDTHSSSVVCTTNHLDTTTSTTSTVKQETKVVVVETHQEVEVVEEYNPHVQRRVKTIVEEIVDGKVVSSSVNEKVQEIS
ncbi:keratin 99 [Aplochiton taeniatus]